MRAGAAMLCLLFLCLASTAEGNKDKPLTPEEAAKKVNEKCTVEMLVKSSRTGKGVGYLNSREDFRDEKNLTVFLSREGYARLQAAKVDDPATYYKNKTIRVTGMVKLYRGRPELVVDRAEQIQVLEKK